MTLFCGNYDLNAQENGVNSLPGEVLSGSNELIINKKASAGIFGSPYLYNDFRSSEISNVNENVNIRYNIYSDEIEFKRDDKIYILPKDSKYHLIRLKDDEKIRLVKGVYYILLDENDQNFLLKKVAISFTDAKPALNSYTEDKPAEYRKEKPKYYLFYDGHLLEINKKINFKNFKKADEIEGFIKVNKINYTNEEHLVRLFDFISN